MLSPSINGTSHKIGGLYVGTAKENVRTNIGVETFNTEKERKKVNNKQIKVFDCTNTPVSEKFEDSISKTEKETQNKKEKTEKTWKTIGLALAGIAIAVGTFLVAKKLKNCKSSKIYTKEDCNVIRLPDDNVSEILKQSIGDKKYRIATSGYSFNIDGYEEPTKKFLKSMDIALESKNTGYILPPALEKGSIYDITAEVSGLGKKNALFVTADRYYDNYLNLENFAGNIDMKKYLETPMLVFPTPEVYTKATANASNVLVCTGGRKVAVTEIVEALKRRSKVVLLDNLNLNNGTYNTVKNEVENAAKYFKETIILNKSAYPLSERLELEELMKHPSRINQLVRVYHVDDAKSAVDAGTRAANFIKSKTLYDYIPEEIVEKRWCT